jgi:HEAT repeat protein
VDVGTVAPTEAAAYFLGLARGGAEEPASQALFAATLARGVTVWTELLDLARDRSCSSGVRESAVFWLGQEAAAAATEGLESLVDADDEDLEVRQAAVFALSQRPSDESVPALSRIARTHTHPEVREAAFFWLAQHDDPRVIDLFEEVLTR